MIIKYRVYNTQFLSALFKKLFMFILKRIYFLNNIQYYYKSFINDITFFSLTLEKESAKKRNVRNFLYQIDFNKMLNFLTFYQGDNCGLSNNRFFYLHFDSNLYGRL